MIVSHYIFPKMKNLQENLWTKSKYKFHIKLTFMKIAPSNEIIKKKYGLNFLRLCVTDKINENEMNVNM
jgi:hypothetical protein